MGGYQLPTQTGIIVIRVDRRRRRRRKRKRRRRRRGRGRRRRRRRGRSKGKGKIWELAVWKGGRGKYKSNPQISLFHFLIRINAKYLKRKKKGDEREKERGKEKGRRRKRKGDQGAEKVPNTSEISN